MAYRVLLVGLFPSVTGLLARNDGIQMSRHRVAAGSIDIHVGTAELCLRVGD